MNILFVIGLVILVAAGIFILLAHGISMKRIDRCMKILNSIPICSYNFSIGDRIRLKGNVDDNTGYIIIDIREGCYWCDADITIPHSKQDMFEKI